jgi:prepilin-type N-terminal cleavage/methylation domain-containing protein
MRFRGFSLVELLVATALSAVLMAAVLAILTGVSRDRRRLTAAEHRPQPQAIVDRFQWDLTNAQTLSQSADGRSLFLVGHGAIDHATLAPNGRLASVTYTLHHNGPVSCLVREQRYLDDPAAPKPWRELVSTGVSNFRVTAQLNDEVIADQPGMPANPSGPRAGPPVWRVPERVRLLIEMSSGVIDRELWVR